MLFGDTVGLMFAEQTDLALAAAGSGGSSAIDYFGVVVQVPDRFVVELGVPLPVQAIAMQLVAEAGMGLQLADVFGISVCWS